MRQAARVRWRTRAGAGHGIALQQGAGGCHPKARRGWCARLHDRRAAQQARGPREPVRVEQRLAVGQFGLDERLELGEELLLLRELAAARERLEQQLQRVRVHQHEQVGVATAPAAASAAATSTSSVATAGLGAAARGQIEDRAAEQRRRPAAGRPEPRTQLLLLGPVRAPAPT